jgi:hypothetical protein
MQGWFLAEWPDEDLSVPDMPFLRVASALGPGWPVYDWPGMFSGYVGGYARATTPEAKKLVLRAVAKDVIIYSAENQPSLPPQTDLPLPAIDSRENDSKHRKKHRRKPAPIFSSRVSQKIEMDLR